MERIDRRKALRNGLLLVGAALGVGAGVSVAESQTGESFRLYGGAFTRLVSGRPSGEPAQRGDRMTMHGQLLAQRDGTPIGEFVGAGFALRHPGVFDESSAGTLEVHTFRLPEGTIVGSGTGAGDGTSQTFAIVGGTGRYLGARGAYESVRSGGEITEFIFRLMR